MSKRINGEGTIYQRKDGRWEGAAYVLLPNGGYQRRRVYGKTDSDVRQKLTELKAASDQGVPAEATGWTVERFLTYWLEHVVKPAAKPRTYQGYEVVVRVHLVPGLGKKRLNKLTGADVRLFLRKLDHTCLCCLHGTDARRPEGKRRCCAVGKCCEVFPSVRLRQQVHAVLRNALEAAVREELIRRNVARLVKIAGPDYQVNRGLVRRNLQRVGGELRAVDPKTDKSRRTVPLLGLTADALRDHGQVQAEERAAAGLAWVETGSIFTTVIGTPIEPSNLRRSWYPLREKIGADSVRFHDLRHTCVSLLLDLGVPPHIVRDIAGHSAIEVTMTIYAHAALEQKRNALRKLDDELR